MQKLIHKKRYLLWAVSAVMVVALIALMVSKVKATSGVSGVKKTQYTSIFDCLNWTVPTGVTQATVEAWGGGGGGGNASVNGGGGGGGGAYARSVSTVTAGSTYAVACGAGGSSSSGSDTTISTPTTVVADAGLVGGNGSATNGQGVGGAGGTVAGSTGTTKFAGGQGGGGVGGTPGTTAIVGGGGGGSGGDTAAGNVGQSVPGGATQFGGNGGLGGLEGGAQGGTGAGQALFPADTGRAYGGGGGGASTTAAKAAGRAGLSSISPSSEANTAGAATGSSVGNQRDQNLGDAQSIDLEALKARVDNSADPGAVLPIEFSLDMTTVRDINTGAWAPTVYYRIYQCSSSCGTFANWSNPLPDQTKVVTVPEGSSSSGFVSAGNTQILGKSGDITYYSVLAWTGDVNDTLLTCTTNPTDANCMRVNVSVPQSNVISAAGPTITGCNPCDPSHTANDRSITASGTVGYQHGARGSDYITGTESATVQLFTPNNTLVSSASFNINNANGTYSGSIFLPTPTEAGTTWKVTVDYCHNADCITQASSTFTVKLEIESVIVKSYSGSLNPCTSYDTAPTTANAASCPAGITTGEQTSSTFNRDEWLIVYVKLFNPDDGHTQTARSATFDQGGTNVAMTLDQYNTTTDTYRYVTRLSTSLTTGSKVIRASATVQGTTATTTATGIASDPSGCGTAPNLCHNQDASMTASATLTIGTPSSLAPNLDGLTLPNRGDGVSYSIAVNNARGEGVKSRGATGAATKVTITPQQGATTYTNGCAGAACTSATTDASGNIVQSGSGNAITAQSGWADTYDPGFTAVKTYDAETKPESATPAWTRTGSDCGTVSSPTGLLTVACTSATDVYSITDSSFANATGSTVEARMKVTTSGTSDNRLHLKLEDGTRTAELYFSTTQIQVGASTFAMDTTGFHSYRMTLAGTAVLVYVDGVQRISTTTATTTSSKQVSFGDGSGSADSSSQWDLVKWYSGGAHSGAVDYFFNIKFGGNDCGATNGCTTSSFFDVTATLYYSTNSTNVDGGIITKAAVADGSQTASLFNRGETIFNNAFIYTARRTAKSATGLTSIVCAGICGSVEGSNTKTPIATTSAGLLCTDNNTTCTTTSNPWSYAAQSADAIVHDQVGAAKYFKVSDGSTNSTISVNEWNLSDLAFISSSSSTLDDAMTVKVGGTPLTTKVLNFGESTTFEFFYHGARGASHLLKSKTFTGSGNGQNVYKTVSTTCDTSGERTFTTASDANGLVANTYTPTSGTDAVAHTTAGSLKCVGGRDTDQNTISLSTNFTQNRTGSVYAASDLVRFDANGTGTPDNGVVMTQAAYNLGETVSGTFYTIGARDQVLNFANSCATPATDTKCTIIYKNGSSTEEGTSRKLNLTPSSGQVTVSYTATSGADAVTHDTTGDQKRISWRDTNDNFAGTADAQFTNKYAISDLLLIATNATYATTNAQNRVTTSCVANANATCANEAAETLPRSEALETALSDTFNHGETIQATGYLFNVRSAARVSATGLTFQSVASSSASCATTGAEATNFTGTTTDVSGIFAVTRVVASGDTNASKWLKMVDGACNYFQQSDVVSGTISNEWTISTAMRISTASGTVDGKNSYDSVIDNTRVYNLGESTTYSFFVKSVRNTNVGRAASGALTVAVTQNTGHNCTTSLAVPTTGNAASTCSLSSADSKEHVVTPAGVGLHKLSYTDGIGNVQVDPTNTFGLSDLLLVATNATYATTNAQDRVTTKCIDNANATCVNEAAETLPRSEALETTTSDTFNYGETIQATAYLFNVRSAARVSATGLIFQSMFGAVASCATTGAGTEATNFTGTTTDAAGIFVVTRVVASGDSSANGKDLKVVDGSCNYLQQRASVSGSVGSEWNISATMRISTASGTVDGKNSYDSVIDNTRVYNLGESSTYSFYVKSVRNTNVGRAASGALTVAVTQNTGHNCTTSLAVPTTGNAASTCSLSSADSKEHVVTPAGVGLHKLSYTDGIGNVQVDPTNTFGLSDLLKVDVDSSFGGAGSQDIIQTRCIANSTIATCANEAAESSNTNDSYNRGENIEFTGFLYGVRSNLRASQTSLSVFRQSTCGTNLTPTLSTTAATSVGGSVQTNTAAQLSYVVPAAEPLTNYWLRIQDTSSNYVQQCDVVSGTITSEWSVATSMSISTTNAGAPDGNMTLTLPTGCSVAPCLYNRGENVNYNFYLYSTRSTLVGRGSGSGLLSTNIIDGTGAVCTPATASAASTGLVSENCQIASTVSASHDKTGVTHRITAQDSLGNQLLTPPSSPTSNTFKVSDLLQISLDSESTPTANTRTDCDNSACPAETAGEETLFNRGESVHFRTKIYNVRDQARTSLGSTILTPKTYNGTTTLENTLPTVGTDASGIMNTSYTVGATDAASTGGTSKKLEIADSFSNSFLRTDQLDDWQVSTTVNMCKTNVTAYSSCVSGDQNHVNTDFTVYNRGETVNSTLSYYSTRGTRVNRSGLVFKVHTPTHVLEQTGSIGAYGATPGLVSWSYVIGSSDAATSDTVGALKHLAIVDSSNGATITEGAGSITGIESGNDWGVSTLFQISSNAVTVDNGVTITSASGNTLYNLGETVTGNYYIFGVRTNLLKNQTLTQEVRTQDASGVDSATVENGPTAQTSNASTGQVSFSYAVSNTHLATHDLTGRAKYFVVYQSGNTVTQGSLNRWKVSNLIRLSTTGTCCDSSLITKKASGESTQTATVYNLGEAPFIDTFIYNIRGELLLNKVFIPRILNSANTTESSPSNVTSNATTGKISNLTYTIGTSDTATHDLAGSKKKLKLTDNVNNNNYVQTTDDTSIDEWAVSNLLRTSGDGVAPTGSTIGSIRSDCIGNCPNTTAAEDTVFNRGETVQVTSYMYNVRGEVLGSKASYFSTKVCPTADTGCTAVENSKSALGSLSTGQLCNTSGCTASTLWNYQPAVGDVATADLIGSKKYFRVTDTSTNYLQHGVCAGCDTNITEWSLSSMHIYDVFTKAANNHTGAKQTLFTLGTDSNIFVFTNTKNVRDEGISLSGISGSMTTTQSGSTSDSCTVNAVYTQSTGSDGWASPSFNCTILSTVKTGGRNVVASLTDVFNNAGSFTQFIQIIRPATPREPQPNGAQFTPNSDTSIISGTNDAAGVSGTKKTQYTSNFDCSNWTAPTGVSQATVEAWGAGGAGGTALVNGGGGGGGGAYARSDVSVTAGNTYNVSCGPGGVGNGPNSTFNSTTVVAAGGAAGGNGSATNGQGVGGAGGTTAASTGTTKFAGGAGGGGTGGTPGTTQVNGGGGASGAGNATNGGNGSSDRTPGNLGPDGGGGGASGASATSSAGNALIAGGGGGGASTSQLWSDGANGKVVISPFAESNTAGAASGTTIPNKKDNNITYNTSTLGYESLHVRVDTAADPGAIIPVELRLMSTVAGPLFTRTVRYRIYSCNADCTTFANWTQNGLDKSVSITVNNSQTDSGFVNAGNDIVLNKSGDITYYSVLAWSSDRETTNCGTDPTHVNCMRANVSVSQSELRWRTGGKPTSSSIKSVYSPSKAVGNVTTIIVPGEVNYTRNGTADSSDAGDYDGTTETIDLKLFKINSGGTFTQVTSGTGFQIYNLSPNANGAFNAKIDLPVNAQAGKWRIDLAYTRGTGSNADCIGTSDAQHGTTTCTSAPHQINFDIRPLIGTVTTEALLNDAGTWASAACSATHSSTGAVTGTNCEKADGASSASATACTAADISTKTCSGAFNLGTPIRIVASYLNNGDNFTPDANTGSPPDKQYFQFDRTGDKIALVYNNVASPCGNGSTTFFANQLCGSGSVYTGATNAFETYGRVYTRLRNVGLCVTVANCDAETGDALSSNDSAIDVSSSLVINTATNDIWTQKKAANCQQSGAPDTSFEIGVDTICFWARIRNVRKEVVSGKILTPLFVDPSSATTCPSVVNNCNWVNQTSDSNGWGPPSNDTNNTWTYPASSPTGTYTVTMSDPDASGNSVSASITITVTGGGGPITTDGTLISSVIDLGQTSTVTGLYWTADTPTVLTFNTSVQFQLSTCTSTTAATCGAWFGPDGTNGTYFTAPSSLANLLCKSGGSVNQTCTNNLKNVRYLRYQAFLHSDNLPTVVKPILYDVNFVYTLP